MANIAILFVSLSIGILLKQRRQIPADAHRVLNQLLIVFFIPMLTLRYVPETRFDERFTLPIVSAWLIFAIGAVFFSLVARPLGIERKSLGALILTGGIGSTSFVGLPVFELLYGQQGLEIGIFMSQAGTFLVCIVLGITVAAWFSDRQLSGRAMLHRIVVFPPFLAFLLGLLLNLVGYRHPPFVAEVLGRLSSPFAIVALIAIGLQIDLSVKQLQTKYLAIGMSYKLLLAPLLIYGLCVAFADPSPMVLEITVIGAAMGSMNTVAIIAIRSGLNPPLASQMVGISIPLSFLVIYLIHWLL